MDEKDKITSNASFHNIMINVCSYTKFAFIYIFIRVRERNVVIESNIMCIHICVTHTLLSENKQLNVKFLLNLM